MTSAELGAASSASHCPGFHAPLRRNAFGQCWYASSTPTTIALRGGLPTAVSCSSSRGSAQTQARPFTRSVVARPGMTKISPARPVSTMLWTVSSRLLPVASGTARVNSSRTATNPGGPPRGVTSQLPSAALATNTSDDRPMTARAASWIRSTALRRAISPGSSYSSRNWSALRTAVAFTASNIVTPPHATG